MTLVIGGAASGKSCFAEEWVMRLPGKRIYLATMEALDAESEARIARHRLLRAGRGFETLERSLDLSHCAVPDRANVLLEDLPNLLANEMFRPGGGGEAAALEGVAALRSRSENLTVVTGELFSGGAQYSPETLAYLKALAHVNRALAAAAESVVELVCGVPNILKGELL